MADVEIYKAIDVLVEKTRDRVLETANYYRLKEKNISDSVWQTLGSAQESETYEEALTLADKAIRKIQLQCLAFWAKKKIRGPINLESLLKSARSAESLADYLEAQGDEEGARKQRDRAKKLKAEARELKGVE